MIMKHMKKYVIDLTVRSVERLHERYVLLKLTDSKALPPMLPGQFVEVRVDGSPATFLRRPISINFVDYVNNELWLLVATVGEGTRRLASLQAGEKLNCMLPLGNGFSLPIASSESGGTALYNRLLVGGGVGVAPLLYLGARLKEGGAEPTFLLGARTSADLLMLAEFRKYGRVLVTTEDGSQGERGFVTNHSVLQQERFGLIQCCGPTPMMKAVASYARTNNIECEVSLENLMACGLGACLCCVEKVKASPLSKGGGETTNVCVCKEGPVFNIKQLLWD
jgi:dihydroorotate dehydrogenase electron transfer subunit